MSETKTPQPTDVPVQKACNAASGDDTVVRFEDVHKAFGPLKVHRGVSFSIRKGETMSLLGGSGTGKSVLLKEMIGLLKPDRGSIFVFGQDIAPMNESQLMPVRRDVGMLFQGAALFDSLTVAGNIAYPLREHFPDMSEEEIHERIETNLELVGLPGTEDKMPDELSGGMKKRVGLARAMAVRPKVMLYDEPTTGLDPTNVNRINDLIVSLCKEHGITSIMVTHDMECVRAITDRITMLWEGKVEAVGTVEEMDHSEKDLVRRFMSGDMS